MKTPQLNSNESLRDVALSALVDVASNLNAPAAARAAAARTLMEAIGAIGRLQDLGRISENRNASEMTPTEISEEIARLSQRLPLPKMRKMRS
jgi:hypothetical protein